MIEAFVASLVGVLKYQCVGVALFLPLEIVFPKARISLKQRADGLIFLLAAAPLAALLSAAIQTLRPLVGVDPILLPAAVSSPIIGAILLALWLDFQFYVLHRLEHRFLWRFHAVHHSIRNLSAANSYHHLSEALWFSLSTIPLTFVNIEIAPVFGILSAAFHYQQFYIHSSAKPHFGPLRWLLVDNRYHRIHHSTNPEHFDKNFAAMTPLWDWLGGTLYMPRGDEWPEVGLDHLDEPQSLYEWLTAPWRLGLGEGLARSSDPSGDAADAPQRRPA